MDYEIVNQSLVTFDANSSSEMCININLFADNITEMRESFRVLASSLDSSVQFVREEITVFIIDNDSESSYLV